MAYRHWRQPMEFLLGLWRQHGDVFMAPLPGFGNVIYVASPDLVTEVFRASPSLLLAGAANAMALEPALGRHALLTLDGEEHRRQRRLLNPGLHGAAITAHDTAIKEITNRAIDRLPVGRPFAMYPHMEQVAIEVIARTIFGAREDAAVDRLGGLIREFTKRSHAIMVLPFLRHRLGRFGPWARFERTRAALDEFIYDAIDTQRSSPRTADADTSLLALLTEATDDAGTLMSNEEIRDELIALIVAGHITTATALAWVWERLVHTPEVLARVQRSVDGGAHDYVAATVKETLRSRPVISEVWRRTTTELPLGGFVVPEGTIVSPAIAVIHHREDLFPEPESFQPERFLESELSPFFVPFGGGNRRCIGAALAEFEIAVVVETVLRRVALVASTAKDEKIVLRHMALAPAKGARVVLSSRRSGC